MSDLTVKDVCRVLDDLAPSELAEDWDNVGLLIGEGSAEVRRLLLCIDLTREVLDEAQSGKAEMVLAYHPVIFKPLSRLTADRAPVVYEAIRSGLAVYCPHTALDSASGGTNDVLADLLGLQDRRPLEPTSGAGSCKIVTFVPESDQDPVAQAAFAAGAGRIGEYDSCSFATRGLGTFRGSERSNPTVGQAGTFEAVEELRLELIAPSHRVAGVCEAIRLAHSYEEPPIDVYPLREMPGPLGLGRAGRLPRPVKLGTLLGRIRKGLGVNRLLIAGGDDPERMIGTVAVAAGACGGMWHAAADAGASLYLTGEMKHHDALAAAAAGLCVVCAGHSNTERITLSRLAERLSADLPGLQTALSATDRDPFHIV